jgi:5-methylcytosine-specific restriction endonuclease McrA
MNGRRINYKRRVDVDRKTAVALLGGECAICGSKNNLIFHHRNPKEKRFEISQRLGRLLWSDLLKEISKCVLLCNRCHGFYHGGRISQGELDNVYVYLAQNRLN